MPLKKGKWYPVDINHGWVYMMNKRWIKIWSAQTSLCLYCRNVDNSKFYIFIESLSPFSSKVPFIEKLVLRKYKYINERTI